MTRLRGWAPKGERLVDKVPHGRWKTATFLAALRNDRIDAPCLFDGPINGERFHWPAAGFVDTEIRCFRKLEASDAEVQVQSRVQGRGGPPGA